MSQESKISLVEAHTFDTSTLSGSYQAIDADGFPVDLIKYKLFNNSDNVILISYDGATLNDVIPAQGTFILDISLDKNNKPRWPAKRVMYVKSSGTAAGTLYEIGYTLART